MSRYLGDQRLDLDLSRIQAVSTYRISQQALITYLRRTFGEGKFHVTRSGDVFELKLPRHLTDEEIRKVSVSTRDPKDEYHHDLRKMSDSDSDPESDMPFAEAAEAPMIQEFNQNSFKVPSEDNVKDLNLIYSVSNMHIGRNGVASSLYSIKISQGFTSKVFEVDARWSWNQKNGSQSDIPQGFKVAVKRLSRHTERGQFCQEYDALKAATRNRHRNVVELLNAFRYEDENKVIRYNFSFPLAVGNLKEIFNHHPHKNSSESNSKPSLTATRLSDDFYLIANKSLWSEFEGLASALAHLHGKCHIAHSDIKPSNVLLYGPYGSPPTITAKLTDFGLAVDLNTRLTWQLGSKEAQSAWQYDAPEIRTAFKRSQNPSSPTEPTGVTHDLNAEQLMSGDVWKLGSVFTEMLTFLIEGLDSTLRFRKFITTTVGELTSDDLSDSRFDDGEKVKVEVLQWLSLLATKDPRAHEMHHLLRSMFDRSPKRPSSGHVARVLKSSSLCNYFDGARVLNFTPSIFLRRPSIVDRYKQMIEKIVGSPVDWRPFKDVNRSCLQGYSRVSWHWSSTKLYIDVPDDQAQVYKDRCQAVSDIAEPALHPSESSSPGSIPPVHSDRQNLSPFTIEMDSSANNYPPSSLPVGSQSQNRPNDMFNNGPTNQSQNSDQSLHKEIYWCVDRAWSEPRSTSLCSLQQQPELRDDESLCKLLIKEYNRVRAWKGRFLSWKSCQRIEFIKFARTSIGRDDIVRVQMGLPPFPSPSYDILRSIPEGAHMKIAARELIAGIYQPEGCRGRTSLLDMIPKRNMLQPVGGRGSEDWGMHALPIFSLWKILAWIAFLTTLGLAFVIFWLVFVSKTDLQNAFIPFTFLATMVMIGLGLPQLLEID